MTTKKKTKVSKLTKKQKQCTAEIIPEMMRELKKGRWSSRKQAVAVGLSKAKKEC